MKLLKIFVLFLCLIPGRGVSQPAYRATLPTVDADAFYGIDLPYEVVGGARPDLADIRITDKKGKEVAWLLREDAELSYSNEFIPLAMDLISTARRTDLLITSAGKPLSSLALKIKNADVNKEAILSGSDDGARWFAVKDRFQLNRNGSVHETEALLNLSFPLSDYKFYKLSLNDSLSAPLNVVGVGQVKAESFYKQHLLEVPLKMSSFATKEKSSGIQLVLPFKYQIERLDFYISSPRYYQRNLSLLQPYSARFAATLSNEEGYPQPVALGVYADTLRLSVFHGDDQPVTVDSVKAYVRKYCLVAELKKGEEYTLAYGDPQATFPQYDLSFGKQVPDTIDHVKVHAIRQLSTEVVPVEEPSAWLVFFKTYGIWIVIALIIIQILYIVRKMLK